jgi:TolA-binding protein
MIWGNNMRIKITLLFILLICTSGIIFSDTPPVRFAISPFVPITASAEAENAGTLAAVKVEQGLSKGKWFELRKSSELENFMDNLALAQAGIGDEKKVATIGKQLQIKYLTVGSIAKFGSLYEVDSRSVNIDNWSIVHSSGCSAIDVDTACGFINKDVELTLTKENLDEREKNSGKLPTIAVNRFEESNISAQSSGYGGAFAEVLNSELGARNGVSATERTHLRSVIDAKAMELCGIYGTDTSKGFNTLGVSYKVDGEIRVFPATTCIRYKVSTTSNGRIVYIGFSEIATARGIRPLSRKIAREIDDAINNKIGTLELKSSPSAADVLIDGQPYGKTPLIISLVNGEHTIRALASGYETTDMKLTINPASINKSTVTMIPVSTKLYEEAVRLEQSKKWQGAIDKYSEFAAKYDSTDEANKALYRKGHILLLFMNNAKGALETFESLVQRYPDAETRAEAYFGMARSYKVMGDTALLKQTLDILYSRFPNEIATEEARAYFGSL